jgi:uncharacterized membrane protein YkoI
MKKLMFAICFLFGAAVAVNAQDSTATPPPQDQSTQYQQGQDDKEGKEIAVSELPALIQDQLRSQDYAGWTVSKARTKEKDGQTMYAVELKNGDQVKKVKFDAQGNVLKEKEKKDN